MLGGGDPVGVDRLDVARVRPRRASGSGTARGSSVGLVDLALGDRRPADPARRLGDERQRHHRRAREVVARLLVGDVDQLPKPHCGAEHRQRRLHVDARIAGAHAQRMRLGGRQPGLQLAVDEQAPDLLERNRRRRAPRCRRRGSAARRRRGRARRSRWRRRRRPRGLTALLRWRSSRRWLLVVGVEDRG